MDKRKKIIRRLCKKYDDAGYLTESLFWVRKGNKVGIFSVKKQALVVLIDHDKIIRITETLFLVWKDNKAGLFSSEKEFLILPVEYDKILYRSNVLFKLVKGKDVGSLNLHTGEIEWERPIK